jgi:hypothetical protein
VCLIALLHRAIDAAPVLVAANREERYDRPSDPPAARPGPPRVMCGLDREAGGTWLGVSEAGVLVAVTNRPEPPRPDGARSRGLLCRELLAAADAVAAADRAVTTVRSGRYAGVNVVCADRATAVVVHGAGRPAAVPLGPGLHLLANGDVNRDDDGRIDAARRLFGRASTTTVEGFLDVGATVCGWTGRSDPAVPIVLRGAAGGTVSSDLVAVTADPARSVWRHAEGPPDRTPYSDLSPDLRAILRPWQNPGQLPIPAGNR